MQITDGPKTDKVELSKRKAALLVQYDAFRRLEGETGNSHVLKLFFVNLVISVAMGVLLNVGTTPPSALAGAFIFILFYATRIASALESAYTVAKAGESNASNNTSDIDRGHPSDNVRGTRSIAMADLPAR